MARDVESISCDAWVIGGNADVGALQPCKGWGEGKCLKDLLRERNVGNVAVNSGSCLADRDAGIDDPGDASALFQEVTARQDELPGIKAMLDALFRDGP